MKLSITRLMIISACAVALPLGASLASAQTVQFDLPVEVHWGSAVLQPGSYTLSNIDSPSGGSPMLLLHGLMGNRIELPGAVDTQQPLGKRSYLKLVKLDGSYYVREYVSSTSGVAMEFATPKMNRHELKAEVRVLEASGS